MECPSAQSFGEQSDCLICERLLDALVELLGEGAFREVTAVGLCRRAAVGPEELATHVGSLDGCLVAAYQRAVDRNYDLVSAAFAAEGEWDERLRRAIAAVVGEISVRPGVGRLCYVDGLEHGGPEVWLRRERVRQRLVALLAHDDGEDGLPPLRFELIVGAVHMALRGLALDPPQAGEVPGAVDAILERALVFEPLAA